MYCNQCGCEIKDTAKFCKKCGAVVEEEIKETSQLEQNLVRFFYTKRKPILIVLILLLIISGGIVVGISLWKNNQKESFTAMPIEVAAVDLRDEYEMEDNELVLGMLTAVYSDGRIGEVKDYKVYIDTVECAITEGKIDGKSLYDGQHLLRLEWTMYDQDFSYEKTIGIRDKKDTWGKYPDIIGLTGQEIAKKYGKLSAPEFGKLSEGDWGYAYVALPSRNLKLCFPAGLFDNPENYGDSDAQCMEMTGTLNDLFYNMEPEMSCSRLSEILKITLSPNSRGGCSGTLSSGNIIYIGAGEVGDDLYTPDTTVRVTASDSKKAEILDYFF